MPLLVNGEPIKYTKEIIQSLTKNTDWQKEALSLFESSASNIQTLTRSSLVILQGECASIKRNVFECIGTPFATTCNILFIMNKSGTKTACAHLDGALQKKQMVQILNLFEKNELKKEGVNIYIIGGYLDEKEKSIEVTDKILSFLCKDRPFKNYTINLCLLYTSHLNTSYKMIQDPKHKNKEMKVAIPKYQNIAYHLKEHKFISFDIKSKHIPHNTLRGAIGFDDAKKVKIRVVYNCCNAKDVKNGPKIDAFRWLCPDWIQNVLKYNLSDSQILEYFSTSPYAEHDEFAKDSMKLFRFLANNDAKQVFGGKPIYMKCGVIVDKIQKENEDEEEKKSPK